MGTQKTAVKAKGSAGPSFLDLKRAFDTVWREGLYFKLLKFGLSSKLVTIIKDMYSKTQCKVNINGSMSNIIEYFSGMRQGCNLSPTLFNLYLNDLPNFLKNNGGRPVKLG